MSPVSSGYKWLRHQYRRLLDRQYFRRGCGHPTSSHARVVLEPLEPRVLLSAVLELSELLPSNGGNGSVGYVVYGEKADHYSGRSVSWAGDVNGDGYDDVIIAAPLAGENGRGRSGTSYVLFGQADGVGASVDLSTLDGTNGFSINGVSAGDFSGGSVQSAGDVNGDGLADLIIGASAADPNGLSSGASYVVFGRETGGFSATLELSTLNGANGFAIHGTERSDLLGISVAAAGDINTDGYADLIVGSIGSDTQGNNAGASYVVFGQSGGFSAHLQVSDLDGQNGFAIYGEDADDLAGRAVNGAGDMNGDGFADLVIGARRADRNGVNSGTAYVVFGRADNFGPSVQLSTLDGTNGFVINGANRGDNAGIAVNHAGDVNGDGYADLIIGAFSADPSGASSGASYVVYGQAGSFGPVLDLVSLNGANGFAIYGMASGDGSGVSVGWAGDVNSDGYDDLIIGAHDADPHQTRNAGQSYVLFGDGNDFSGLLDNGVLWLSSLDSWDGNVGFMVNGIDLDDGSGVSVSGAGDVNGDGFDDFVIGADWADPNGLRSAGESYVLWGRDFTDQLNDGDVGDSGDNTLTGTALADRLIGGQGDDTLVGQGGADVLRGGEGDDVLTISDTNFQRLAGGRGVDTLRVSGSGLVLDLTDVADNKITGIEQIDLRGNGAHQLILNTFEVLNISNDSNTLIVWRDASDTVEIGLGWTQSSPQQIDGQIFDVFTQGAAVLMLRGVNDAPVNTVPGTQSTSEDTPLVFNGPRTISIRDADAGSNAVEVTLAATNGVITLSGTSGLTFETGTGVSDPQMVFTGTISNINTALSGLVFSPTGQFSGAANLQIVTNDLGNRGSGGARSDSDTVTINVGSVNDAPVNTVPGTQSTSEDTPLVFNGPRTISIRDADAGSNAVEVTLAATNGVITLSGTSGLTFETGTGVSDPQMVFTGTISNINTALSGLVFSPTGQFSGAANLQIVTNDLGNRGSGGARSDSDTVTINVGSVNDAPVNTVPGTQSTSEDTPLVFNGPRTISIRDADAGSNAVEVTLAATNGVITLSGTSGLTFETGTGTSDPQMVFTGTISNINTALSGLVFSPTGQFSGAASLQIVTNDLGNRGSGGARSDSDTVTINVGSVNDAPVNTVPGTQSTSEDTPLVFNGPRTISIRDADAGSNAVEVTLAATNGVITLSGTSGLTFETGTGTSDPQMVFTGTISNINTALSGLVFSPTGQFSGAASLQIVTNDLGNRGSGGARSDSDTVTINVGSVNDAPVNTVPGTQSTSEDTPLVFNGPRTISIRDADAGSNAVEVTLAATNGVITLSGTSGLTFETGTGTSDPQMVFTGTISNINTALSGLVFSPTGQFSGAANLQIVTNDQGNRGSGGARSDSDTVTINVGSVNDAPVNTVPGTQSTSEDTPLVFNGPRTISIRDADAGSNAVEVTLAATNGVITLSGTSGLTFETGTGTSDPQMVFTGTISNINTALSGLVFSPTGQFSGAASLQIVTNDLGNRGSGGARSDSDTVTINVGSVNDAPVNTVPGTQSTSEDTPLVFNGPRTISIRDADAGSNAVEVTLAATNGVITLSGTSGLTFETGTGTSDPQMVFTGTISNINTALSGLVFSPTGQFSGAANLQIVTNDQGNRGSGGARSDSDTVTINVGSVNDAPVNTVPGTQSTSEDTPLVFNGPRTISIRDADAGSNAVEVTLAATNGVITLSGTSGLTFETGTGTSDPQMVFTGTISNINTALSGLVFSPTGQFSGAANLQIVTNDQGNRGSGGARSDSDTVTINVGSVNDAPVNTVPGTQSTSEDTPLVFNGPRTISIRDADAGSNAVEVTLAATNGVITLSGTSGLTFETGTGTSDPQMVFTGTISNINTALSGLVFSPTGQFSGAASLQIVTNDLGNRGSGGARSDSDTVTINVGSVNDAPVNTVPGTQSTSEDTPLVFNGPRTISIRDADAGSNAVEVTLAATNGVITLSGTSGLTFETGTGTSDPQMVFTGTISNINTALSGLVFSPTGQFSGAANLQIVTNDQGNRGSGGARSDSDTVTINVGSVNDAPVNTVPGTQSTSEDTPLVFNGPRTISIRDADAGSNAVEVTLAATNGVITLSGTSGLTFETGTGTSDPQMVFTGTISNINTALSGLVFSPTGQFSGAASLQIVTNDLGNRGSGGARSDSDTVTINVGSVNDAPVNTVPGTQSTSEDTPLVFNGPRTISIRDADAGSNAVEVTLAATNGVITLSGTSGLTFETGTGTSDPQMVFTGTISNINTALSGLVFSPTGQFSGAASLQIVTNDLGNRGSGGARSDSDTVTINVGSVNDAPVNTVPGTQSTSEDTPLVFNGPRTISIRDADAGSNAVEVTLAATNGVITLSGTSGLTFETGTGTSDPQMVFTGTISNINTALSGLVFSPTGQFSGAASLQIVTNDLGNRGSGGARSDSDTVTINVGSVNDAPVNTVPGTQSTSEDTPLVFNGPRTISIRDADAGSNAVEVTLAATNGVITLSGTSGLTFETGTGTSDPQMVFTGTISNINTALSGLVFSPTGQFSGAANLQIVTNDQGNRGSGGARSDSDTVTINVGSVNDAPVNTVPGTQSTSEDTPLVFNGPRTISIRDADAGSNAVEVTLAATNGVITLSGTSGLTFETGTGTSDPQMVFTGTISNINTALSGLVFSPTGQFSGAASLQIVTNDLGNRGSGGARSDSDTVTINVGSVNDAPVNTVPGTQSTSEDTPLVFNGPRTISIRDADAGSNAVEVTLAATNGVITLSGTSGLTFETGTGTSDPQMVFTGTISNINTALSGLVFSPTGQFSGAANLQIVTNDQGNRGSGGARSDSDTVTINVGSVNDAPVNTVPGTQSTSEDTPLVFNGPRTISIRDADAGSNAVEVTLAATNGVITLSGTSGLTFETGTGTSDPQMVFTGTISNINTALSGLVFSPTGQFSGAANLQIVTNDQGNRGSGGARSDSDTVTINVGSVNDAPVNTVPGTQSTSEDTPLVFNGPRTISIRDADAGSNAVEVTLAATNGVITLSGTSGLTFETGTGTSDPQMVFTGTISNINTALSGLVFSPTGQFSGAANLQIVTNDQGNRGSGGARSDSDTVTINVGSVNDAPVNTVPGTQSTSEDTPLVFNGPRTISIRDADAGSNAVEVTLAATNGVITLSGTSGLTFETGTGTSDPQMVFTGTISNINTALSGLVFSPTGQFSGAANLQIVTNDQGNRGSGGARSDSDTVTINVGSVNDAPVNTVPGTQSTSEDTPLVFNGPRTISIRDADAGSNAVEVTLAATNGVITLSGTSGLTFETGTGTSDPQMVFTGTISNINTALSGLVFSPTGQFSGAASLQIVTNDLGNRGSGGARSDSDTVTINVGSVNDAPTATIASAGYTINENTRMRLSGTGLQVSDPDAGNGGVRATLSVTQGQLVVTPGTTGVAVTTAGTRRAVTLDGTLGQINNLLLGSLGGVIDYIATISSTTLTLSIDDQGHSGLGGALVDSETVSIQVLPGGLLVGDKDGFGIGLEDGDLLPASDPVFDGRDASDPQFTDTWPARPVGGADAITYSHTFVPPPLIRNAQLTMRTSDIQDGDSQVLGSDIDIHLFLDDLEVPGAFDAVDQFDFFPNVGFAGIVGTVTIDIPTSHFSLMSDGRLVVRIEMEQLGTAPSIDAFAIDFSELIINLNDAPVNSVPGPQSTFEDTPLVFNGSRTISIADVDAGNNPVEVTLAATNGVITLSGTSGLTFETGTGTSDGQMVFAGTIANINTALSGLVFSPIGQFRGTANLQIVTNDQGNTGPGGAAIDSDTVDITVVPAPQLVYGVDSSTDSLYTLDLTTGAGTIIGPLHPDTNRYMTPVAMAVRPSDGTIFVNNNSPGSDDGLSTVNPATGVATFIGGSFDGALAFDDAGNLYSTNGAGNLAIVNQTTGAATSLGGPTLPRLFGLDFNPADGLLYGITGSSSELDLLVIDPSDGVLIDTRSLSTPLGGSAAGTLLFDSNGVLHGTVNALTNNLFEIDPATGTVSNIRTADFSPQGMGLVPARRVIQEGPLVQINSNTTVRKQPSGDDVEADTVFANLNSLIDT